VSMDSSTLELPSSTEPSTGIFSPGRTTTTSPMTTSSAGISVSIPARMTVAILGCRLSSLRMASLAPPLARALYKHAAIDSEIPSALYNAVAEVLAYIYQLSNWRQTGGVYPVPPRNLPVPPELVPEAV